jgi:two-component system, cell cycle response regulator
LRKILVADHDRDFRELVILSLRFAGYEAYSVSSAEECCRLAKTIRPELILVDMNLPDMSGYGTCEALKLEQETALIPVILMKESTSVGLSEPSKERCEVEVFYKPIDADLLTQKVNAYFKKLNP